MGESARSLQAERAEGIAAFERGDFFTVVQRLTPCASAVPGDVEVLCRLGWAALECRNSPQALTTLRAAVALAPDNLDARIYLGIALLREGQRQEGIASLQKALQLQPGNAQSATGPT